MKGLVVNSGCSKYTLGGSVQFARESAGKSMFGSGSHQNKMMMLDDRSDNTS